ncbi:septum formation protein Maf [Candidatus Uhrbacteria bacterium]|nr:septum formation protein Maf [Candidatus Uhrbacteria bacterium]
MKQIILASTSQRRKDLLSRLRLDFKVIAGDYEEDMTLKLPPKELVQHLALGKAKSVAAKGKNALIISADTIVVLGNQVLGKPHKPEVARRMLKKISGQIVSIITAFAIIDTESGKKFADTAESKITIKKLSPTEIERYVNSGEPLDRAGAFAIQELGAVLIDKVEGDYLGAMGLPLRALADALKNFGVDVLEKYQ